ncbi:oxidoreductase [Tothia fuscella]|uniref:Oxidoreductase n=1 Tax=Tothia fuscella TaxID=1048955 RepID=A0A9P4P052_9PEZI|nr:oxidoreductase [Tothia fuscella]
MHWNKFSGEYIRPSNMSFSSVTLGTGTDFPGVALVTGAASGIGAAIAKSFAEAGCRCIAITDVIAGKLEETREEIINVSPDVVVLTATGDISDERFVNAFINSVIAETGRIDYAVNCAGILGNNQSSTNTSLPEFDRINDINYRGCWLSSRAELRAMLKQEPSPNIIGDANRPPARGTIVNVASQLGIVGRPRCTAYSASKAAVIAMTRGDAIDYAEFGIRVNCICPGIIDTPMTNSDHRVSAMLDASVAIAPMRRKGRPEEVADCALFLCSHKASFVTGAELVCDGGYVIN